MNERLQKTRDTVERFRDGSFIIDIVSHDGTREAWLQHKDCGVSVMMFGIPVRQPGRPAMFYNEFLRMVEDSLTQHEQMYVEDYMN